MVGLCHQKQGKPTGSCPRNSGRSVNGHSYNTEYCDIIKLTPRHVKCLTLKTEDARTGQSPSVHRVSLSSTSSRLNPGVITLHKGVVTGACCVQPRPFTRVFYAQLHGAASERTRGRTGSPHSRSLRAAAPAEWRRNTALFKSLRCARPALEARAREPKRDERTGGEESGLTERREEKRCESAASQGNQPAFTLSLTLRERSESTS